ncbi:MAG: sulfatase-like hydrolase/transferase [Planctomycetota bacterium]
MRISQRLRVLFGIVGFCLASAVATSTATAAEGKPNVVLILADDLGWADLGCYGSKFHQTPHLDRMAAEGVRFTQAYAACPVCSPTRAALLTGKYPQRFQLTDWLPGRGDQPGQRLKRPVIRQELPLEAVTLAEILKDVGYVTGHIGKWHLGGDGFGPLQQGFLSNIGGDQTGSPRDYFAPYKRNGGTIPGLENAPEGEYLTDRYAAEAEKFLEQHHDKPFFLYLPHNAVHTPLKAPADSVAKFAPAAEKSGVGTQRNPVYAAMLASLDEAVGRVIKKLDDLKLTDNTLVIFTSDNGGLATLEGMSTPATINSPLREGKGYLYEGGIRVPLLVKWPGKIKPAVNATAVSSIDLLPTITELCLGKPQDGVDGVSLTPILQQTGELAARDLFWHYPHYANQGSRPSAAIRSGNFKLIEYYETGRRELFNVAQDLGESRNLSAEQPAVVEELAQKLDAWRKQVAAQMMTANADYVPNPQATDGAITLPASKADVFGIMLRFEPLPHKNTLGYWVRPEDWASWEFTVTKPGKFEIEALQGCGTGSGNSEVEFAVGDQKVVMTVQDTGHFQNFVQRNIGTIELPAPGRYTLTVKPLKKPGVAVMDLRQVKLSPK